ncbi:hypothetical protein EVAR_40554_1 [Eumeta japonica]|uniref:Uncharacterized protein n=1 Tax=Eumeta variegata TaxID=151549 RepID=A0A4C1VYV0_EUMVA|nr:hypothetical protein EVAR_40554_1 [Eumeta japonica]
MEIALNIPPCARVVDPRTVHVRIYSTESRRPEGHCRDGGAAERLSRISGCDCNRISEEYSGCDSVVVGRCRPQKSRSTWRTACSYEIASSAGHLKGGGAERAQLCQGGDATPNCSCETENTRDIISDRDRARTHPKVLGYHI